MARRCTAAVPRCPAPVRCSVQGTLSQLDSKTPVMYIDFPEGRMKLFGRRCACTGPASRAAGHLQAALPTQHHASVVPRTAAASQPIHLDWFTITRSPACPGAGTLVFPRNKYMVLRLTAKHALCEDVLESMVRPARTSGISGGVAMIWCGGVQDC